MIRRAPRPASEFLMLRNGVARDTRLSYRASGILADLLSRPDNWTTSADKLARARPNGEGRDAIRKALVELERAGYLVRRKVRGSQGRYTWKQVFYDVPQDDVSAGHTIDGKPDAGNGHMVPPGETGVSAGQARRGMPDAGFPSPQEDLEENQQEDREEDDLNRSDARGARIGAMSEDQPGVTKKINDWRAEDRSIFLVTIGSEKLRSYGHEPWNEGVFETGMFYDAFRKAPKTPIKWPGRYLEALNDFNPTTGVDDWLMSQGLERVV